MIRKKIELYAQISITILCSIVNVVGEVGPICSPNKKANFHLDNVYNISIINYENNAYGQDLMLLSILH